MNKQQALRFNKEMVKDITSLAKPFMKEFFRHQSLPFISAIGKEHASTILNSEDFRNSFDVITTLTTAIFAFHTHCIIEETPFDTKEGNLNFREFQILNFWHEEVCEWSGIDSEKTSDIIKAVLASYNDCYFQTKMRDKIFESYLNQGFCCHWTDPEFHEVARAYIKEKNSLSLFEINGIYAAKMNFQTQEF